jgi:hypothetical protein
MTTGLRRLASGAALAMFLTGAAAPLVVAHAGPDPDLGRADLTADRDTRTDAAPAPGPEHCAACHWLLLTFQGARPSAPAGSSPMLSSRVLTPRHIPRVPGEAGFNRGPSRAPPAA